jgi:hypothetical protein
MMSQLKSRDPIAPLRPDDCGPTVAIGVEGGVTEITNCPEQDKELKHPSWSEYV